MDSRIKKLTTYIDELVVWIRENPEIEIPNREVKRLLVAIENLFAQSTIPIEVWNKIKPKRETDHNAADLRLSNAKRQTREKHIQIVNDLNRDLIEETKRLNEQSKKLRQENKREINKIMKKLSTEDIFNLVPVESPKKRGAYKKK